MLAVVHFGWAKPVNVNPARFKNPKWGMAATALAGPASNFVFAGVCWLLARVVTNDLAAYLINLTLQLNIGLGIFNLIPFPPLDGSKVLFAFLPDKYYFKLMSLERYGMIVLIAVILALRYLGR
jgi:Zn-dependent protease